MKRICLLLLVCTTFLSFGQLKLPKDSLKTPLVSLADEYKKYLPNYSPLAPNAAGIQKYGDYPVNMATGLADISIPIHNVQDGKLNLPITLRINQSGHRIDELASWVGWGISLDFGASLSRVINGGIADDKPISTNYLNTFVTPWDLCNNGSHLTSAEFANQGSYDLEPDLFSYQTPEILGKFQFRQNSLLPFLIPFQPIKISHDYTSGNVIKTFKIVAPSGNEYVFGKDQNDQEATEYQSIIPASGEPVNSGIVAWHLTKILSPNTDDAIFCSYQDGGSVVQNTNSWSTSATFDASTGSPIGTTATPQPSLQTRGNTQKNIHKITFTNGEIEFVQNSISEPRLDQSNASFLKTINIYNIENGVKTLLKKFDFEYTYFTDRTGANGRLKLNKLIERNQNSTEALTHSFDYFTNNYSWKYADGGTANVDDLVKQDYFGYYNGKNNNHLIDIASYNGVSILNGVADRSTVTTFMKEGVLSKITYPTGGFTTFDFEPNKFKQNGIDKLAGGLRIKEIRSFTSATNQASIKRYEYACSDGLGVGKLTNTSTFPTSGMVGFVTNAVGFEIHRTDFIGSNGMAEIGSFEGTPMYYTNVKEFSDEGNLTTSLLKALNLTTNGYSEYDFSFEPDVVTSTPQLLIRDIEPWKRGLVLFKKIFDDAGNLKQLTINTYQEFKQETLQNQAKLNLNNNSNAPCTGTCTTSMPYVYTGIGLSPNSNSPQLECNYPKFKYLPASNKSGQMKMTESLTYLDGVESTEIFTYDQNLLPKTIKSQYSFVNQFHLKEFVYATDPSYDTDAEVLEMRARNMVGIPLESIESAGGIGNFSMVFHQKTIFERFSGNNSRGFTQNLLPKEIWVAPTGTTLEKRVAFSQYDSFGNPTEYKVDDMPTALVWGYNNSLLLAQIQNTSISQVNSKLTSAGITASAFSIINLSNAQLTSLEIFRNSLPKSTLVSWFSYRPNVGLSSQIAPNGLKNSFFYDGFQRLFYTKDHGDFVTGKFIYHYGIANNIVTSIAPRFATSNQNAIFGSTNSIINHQYFDELGRPLQIVGEAQSPDFKGVASADTKYDKYGRVSGRVMTTPTVVNSGAFEPNALSKAKAFYGDNAPKDSIIYENSPLNRVIATFGVGNAWRTANKKNQVFYESAGTDVRFYNVNYNTGDISYDGSYPQNSLYKKRIIDEQGNTSIEITDKRGRLVQRQIEESSGIFLATYYIYDALGRELAVIQPEGYALDASIFAGSADWNNFVFFYKYDARGRTIESHIPNGGTNYSVFDKQDRQVLSQDEYQRTDNKWSFMKYDSLNRTIISGELVNSATRTALQTQFNAQSIRNEDFDANLPAKWHYSDVSFPFSVDSSKAMTVNYYDNYATWRPSSHIQYDLSPHYDAKGLLTGNFRRNTENRAMQLDAFYYDYKNRLIQTKKRSQYFGINYENFDYNFSSQVTHSFRHYHGYTSNSVDQVQKDYGYDHAGRKTSFSHQILYNQTIQAFYTYDDIGRPKTKKIQPNKTYEIDDSGADFIIRPPTFEQANTQDIANKAVILSPGFVANAADISTQTYLAQIDTLGNSGTVDALQTIDYEYNIRGGLNCINCKNKAVRLGNKQNDLFSMKLDYNEDQRYFDGNISKQTWKNPLIPNAQQYKYSYDKSSRLNKAQYLGGNNGTDFSLDTMRYDRNGNILKLKRKGTPPSGAGGLIDDLSYVYDGNKLLSVTDAGNTSGFNDGNTTGNDYEYWNDGSLKRDKNKGIDSIFYNSYLRKVSRVKFSNGNWINFYYDGAGTLLKRKLSNNDVWTYTDDLITKNGLVYQLNHDEGRVTYNYATSKWVYEYDYRDVWGNLRLSFRDSTVANKPPVITQTADYDMLGFEINSFSNQNKNKFLFQKQERISDFDLDIDLFKFRPSDSKIGRFWQIDPLASKYPHNSPYALQENKFGLGIEFEGLELTLFGTASTVVRPMVMPRTSGVVETITRTTPLRVSESSLMPLTEGHHLSPNALKGHPVVQEARQEGFKQDGKENKIDVEKFDKKTGDGRHGNHPEYNKEVKSRYDKFETNNPNRTPNESLDFVRKTVSDMKNNIIKNPDVKINDLYKANAIAPSDNTRVQPPVDKTNVYPCPGGPNCT